MSGPILSGPQRLPTVANGWPLLPLPDEEGRLSWPDPSTSVRETIEAILRTAPGEQLMRPLFGAGLETFIAQPNTLTTRSIVHDTVAAMLKAYEDRIIVDQIAVDPGEDPRLLRVAVAYRLRLTGAPAMIVAAIPVGGA